MSARQLRGVIFDMDGVLVDSHAVHREAWRLFFHTLEREVPESELDFILDGRKRGDILRHFLGDCADAELEEFGKRKDCIFRQMRLEVAWNPDTAIDENAAEPGEIGVANLLRLRTEGRKRMFGIRPVSQQRS